jgi:hypothetical protein
MNKELSVTEYAKLRKCSRANVIICIQKKYKLEGVKSVKRVGNSYVLKVDISHFETDHK